MASTHPMVLQLRFTRSEYKRGLTGLSEEDGCKRLLPMNSISWNVGHLAWQEQRYFLYYGQGQMLFPELQELCAYGAPASTPPLREMLSIWKEVTKAADPWLDSLTSDKLTEPFRYESGKSSTRIFGSLLQRTIYHYWYHNGENLAIRQLLGYTDLPQFVGNIDRQAPYTPE